MATAIWGEERIFFEGGSEVKAIPRLDDQGEIIKQVIIMTMNGERRALDRIVAKIKQTYTGASYKTWHP